MADYIDCQKCGLSATRIQVVWGGGVAPTRVMFIGEAPGRYEDETGIPFNGAAGKILDEFLDQAQLTRDEVYITSVVKCRPPKNRNPSVEEMAACRPYLEEQVAEVNPTVIVALGAFSMFVLTGEKASMGELQGRTHQVTIGGKEHTVLASYHPAAIIYNRKLMPAFLQGADMLTGLLTEHTEEGAVRFATDSEEATRALGAKFAAYAQAGDVAVLSGDLAAGKTHFAQGFADGLGIGQNVPSPTFNIVLEYHTGRTPFYHFDLYRLNRAEELEDIDFYAIVESEGVSLIEWGEKFSESLSEADVAIDMETISETERTLTFYARTPRGQEWIAANV